MTAFLTAFMAAAALSFSPFQSDSFQTRRGELQTVFFGHASIALVYNGTTIYVDPVSSYADYSKLPKADYVIYTHSHGDHFDPKALEALRKPGTVVIANPEVGDLVEGIRVMRNGDRLSFGSMKIKAVAAYNTTEGHTGFHPQGRDNGYVIRLGGKRVYVSGDTEPIPEMRRIRRADIMFLAVNQPYTMTVEQAASAVSSMRPRVFYPYHFGTSDLEALRGAMNAPGTDMRIRPLE